MIFLIAIGVEYSSYVKSIATFAPTFYGYIISVLASVCGELEPTHLSYLCELYVKDGKKGDKVEKYGTR